MLLANEARVQPLQRMRPRDCGLRRHPVFDGSEEQRNLGVQESHLCERCATFFSL